MSIEIERAEAITWIRIQMAQHGLSLSDLGSSYFPCIFWRFVTESFDLSRTYNYTDHARLIVAKSLATGACEPCYRHFLYEKDDYPKMGMAF